VTYDEAVSALYRSPLDAFVAERKRLAAELKDAGDKEGAKRLAKIARPSISAWTVNQLWWQERASFEELLECAARLRKGDLGATRGHRDALAELRTRAAAILREGSHATTDAVLRRVAATLAAVAANGSFDPDPPGALTADRDPPGFDTALVPGAVPVNAAEEERLRAEGERRRLEQEQERARAERQRLEAELQRELATMEARAHDVERLRKALAEAEQRLQQAAATVAELKARLSGSA
jgi:DNA repair exonuclease SbcCD ATPase subunit